MANELGQDKIRVNTVHPTGVLTTLTQGLAGLDGLIDQLKFVILDAGAGESGRTKHGNGDERALQGA